MNANWANISEATITPSLIRALNARLRILPTSITANYTVLLTDDTILADATSGAIAVTLPTVSTSKGYIFTVIRTNTGANAVTVPGVVTGTVTLGAQWATTRVYSDGVEYIVI